MADVLPLDLELIGAAVDPAPTTLQEIIDLLIQRNADFKVVTPPGSNEEPTSGILNNVAKVSLDETDSTPLNNIDDAEVESRRSHGRASPRSHGPEPQKTCKARPSANLNEG